MSTDGGRELAERYFGDDTPSRWREVNEDLAEMTEAFAFGKIWSRPGLGIRDRALVAITTTATQRAHAQLAWHVRGGLRSGLTPTEIRETLIALAGLAGFPVAWAGLEVAEPILREHEASTAA